MELVNTVNDVLPWLRRGATAGKFAIKSCGYPPGFQILCHNCNMGRQLNGGVCPHDALVRELVGA